MKRAIESLLAGLVTCIFLCLWIQFSTTGWWRPCFEGCLAGFCQQQAASFGDLFLLCIRGVLWELTGRILSSANKQGEQISWWSATRL